TWAVYRRRIPFNANAHLVPCCTKACALGDGIDSHPVRTNKALEGSHREDGRLAVCALNDLKALLSEWWLPPSRSNCSKRLTSWSRLSRARPAALLAKPVSRP